MISSFNNEYYFLSNFYQIAIRYKGLDFPSVENAYQASKCYDPKDMKQFLSLPPATVKIFGRKIKMRLDFYDINYDVMSDLINQKFKYPNLKQYLLETAPQSLVEGNYCHDNYWGACQCDKCIDKFKFNKLGSLLQEKRNSITNNPDIFIVSDCNIYHRDERTVVDNPYAVYDSSTMTLFRVQDYTICRDYYYSLIYNVPDHQNYCLAKFDGANKYENCELMNYCIQNTGYFVRLINSGKLKPLLPNNIV